MGATIERSSGASVQDASGAAVGNPTIESGTVAGPASYSTGGFATDLSARFSSLTAVLIVPQAEGVLPGGLYPVVEPDTPGAGQFRTSLFVATDSTPDTPSAGAANAPTGVSVEAASVDTGAVSTTGDAGSVLGTGAAMDSTHTHNADFLYDHDHAVSSSPGDSARREIAATTDLSTVTFRYVAIGTAV